MARPRKSKSLSLAQQVFFRPHRNQFLFSDHYLNELLPLDPVWSDPPGLKEAFDRLVSLYAQVSSRLPHQKEKMTEKDWIQPVLDLLCHSYQLDPSLPTDTEGVKAPDYAFFASQRDREKAFQDRGKPAYWPQALAVGDAKKWGFPLDRKAKGKAIFSNANPNFQIDYYLRATQKRWGILTNGRFWRLYNQEKSYTLSTYYEVDLVDLIDHANLNDFKYFYLFFRMEAFLPAEQEKCFLDRAYSGSTDYAAKLEDSLKEQVYKALLTFAKGALALSANRLDRNRDLKAIHDNALIFLYRLIFILYAESRGLLPKDNLKYWNGPSLHALKLEVASRRDKGEAYDDKTTRLWARLRRLFKMINDGNEAFGIPPYNGGLFKPDKQDGHPFLEKMRLGDSVVAEIVDLLARRLVKETDSRVPVDYRDLGVRQLGSIYEGLLEFKLMVASEPMVAVKEKGKELVVPKPEVGTRKVLQEYKPGDLYAVNDKGERKATGSYFTPEYIVDYIVKHAIGPLLEGKEKAEEILAMRFLDPAMGSGHFLVHVVDFVAKHLIENCSDVYDQDALKNVVQDEIPTLKRLVVERCVYGVDLNPLAVELAKLSLWLNCVAKDKPLSFLNHHLRCGNSLIGVWLKDLGNLPVKRKAVAGEQGDLFRQYFTQDVCRVLSGFKQIEELPSDSIRNIHKKEKVWDSIRDELKPYERIADLWVSTYFGNDKVDGAVYQDLVANIRHGGGLLPKKRREEVLTLTQGIAKEKRFFHWEIAFPEAFFDRFGRDLEEGERGFDAVIGNPPYIGFHGMEGQKPYLRSRYASCSGKFDIYVAFIEGGLSLLKKNHPLSFICPSTFFKRDYAEAFRVLFTQKWILKCLIDFGTKQIFDGVTNYTCIPVIFNNKQTTSYAFIYGRAISAPSVSLPSEILNPDGWILGEPQHLAILTHLIDSKLSRPLSDVADSISEGIVTGCNDVFVVKSSIIKKEAIEATFLRPHLSGENIHKWVIDEPEEVVIYPYQLVNGRTLPVDAGELQVNSPLLWRYLCENRERLSGRPYFENSTKLWFELWNQRSLTDQVSKKIVVPEVEFKNKFAFVDERLFYGDTTCGIRIDGDSQFHSSFVLALLNSQLLTFAFRLLTVPKANDYLVYKPMYLSRLPIRRIHFMTPEGERKRRMEGLRALYEKGDEAGVLAGVEGCLPRDGKGEFLALKSGATGAEERSDVVHDFLAFLAERMIALHKDRQDKAKQFTGWLQEIKEVDTGALKTALKEFWTLDEDGLAQAFKAKKIRASAENWSEIKDELAKYRKAILALNVKITFTDDLIDRIVYRLYGLTKDEIKLVKENTL
jgi:hypothetical protein